MKFTIDTLPEYEGESLGFTWNGFACPKFARETALQILDDLTARDWIDYIILDDTVYIWNSDCVGDSDYEEWSFMSDGWIDLGAGCWCWDKV